MEKGRQRKLGVKEDWTVVPYLLIVSAGFIISIYDFWKIQNLSFKPNIPVLIGIILTIVGGALRITSRMTLRRAGFGLLNSSRLQIVENQRLVTDGVYRHIRHPLYLGEITRNIGFTMILSSLNGFVVMLVGNVFLLLRIEIEEMMLVEEFGQEYLEYRKRTKKLIPTIY